MSIRAERVWLMLVGLIIGLSGGYVLGNQLTTQYYRSEILLLMSLPEPSILIPTGEFYATIDPPVLWNKVGRRMLAFRPMPSNRDISVVQMFSDPVPLVNPAPSPKKGKKETK